MLTNDRFAKLSLIDRAELLLEQGQMLMSRISGSYLVTLYRLNEFYAEVWYCSQTPQIHRIDCINLDDVYKLYEENIDFSDIKL
jgi:hypothetical protein